MLYSLRRGTVRAILLAVGWLACGGAAPLLAQKTDTLIVRNGDVMTGEIKELQRGKAEFKTDAAGTIYVKWTRVLTAETDKIFDIDLDDGTKYFGSLRFGNEPRQVKIAAGRDTIEVATISIVRMVRVKETFWKRLDGHIDLGANFTQQNAKTDLNLNAQVKYKKDLNNWRFDLSTSFSRQDSAENISRLNTSLTYLREFKTRWYFGGLLSGEENSQLSLDIRGTAGGAGGISLIQSSKIILATAFGLAFAREKFIGQDPDDAFQGMLLTDFEFFSWGELSTDFSSRLQVIPVFNQSGRWRISFISNFKREIVKDFYFNVGLNEQFDSKPPTQDTNRNDFSVTTSFGWSF